MNAHCTRLVPFRLARRSLLFAAILAVAALPVSATTLAAAPAARETPIGPAAYYRLRDEALRLQGEKEFARAAEIYQRLLAANDEDGTLWFRLGQCRMAQRRYADTVAPMRRAYAFGAWTRADVALEIARAFARAGQADSAVGWIETSLADGLEERSELAGDEDFAALASHPRFRRAAGILSGTLARETGWRRDLDYLVAEVKRLHYVYRWKALPAEFEAAARKLDERIPSLSDAAVVLEMQRLLAMLGDGHTTLYPAGERVAWRPVPITLHGFADGIYVADAPDSASAWRGARIERIGTHPVGEVMSRIDPYVSRDNANGPRVMGPYYVVFPAMLHALGLLPDATRLPLTAIAPDGTRLEGAFAAADVHHPPHLRKLAAPSFTGAPPAPLYLRRVQDPFWFEALPGDSVVYFQFNQVMDGPGETLRQFAVRLRRHIDEHPVRVLIVDVRHNNGGNGDLLVSLMRTLVHFETLRPGARMFVITGPQTFSAAQVFIAQLDRLTNAVFAGEPSGSRPTFVGESTPLRLPWSGSLGSISSRLHQSSSIEQRSFIPPEIPVPSSGAAWLAGRDAALEAVLEVVRGEAN